MQTIPGTVVASETPDTEEIRQLLAERDSYWVRRDLSDVDAIVCTGLSPEHDTIDGHAPVLEAGLALSLLLICANPEKVVRIGDRIVPYAGAIADQYETIGGPTIHFGKPHRPIYDECFTRLRALEPGLTPSSILAIGDGLDTDIAGANAYGMVSALVTGGVYGAASDSRSSDREGDMARPPIAPDFIIPEFAW